MECIYEHSAEQIEGMHDEKANGSWNLKRNKAQNYVRLRQYELPTSLDTNRGNILLPRPEIYIGSEPSGTYCTSTGLTDALSEDKSEARVGAGVR